MLCCLSHSTFINEHEMFSIFTAQETRTRDPALSKVADRTAYI